MAAAARTEPFTYQEFKDWNVFCRVRSVQKELDKFLDRSEANGTTLEEELAAQNHKDYASFSRSCPQFPLFCWPSALAELGSGFVLYFHFVGFLAAILVLVMLLQIPAMSTYTGQDWLTGWHWHEWEDGWSSNSDACACIGEASGGLFDGFPKRSKRHVLSNKGLFCAPWDMALDSCQTMHANPGKWCCRSWCYAKPSCSTRVTSPPSMSNRPVVNGKLVRSYSACSQEPMFVRQCSAFPDVPFSDSIFEPSRSWYVSKSWLTPGNFGPDQADNTIIPLTFLAMVAIISFLIVLMYQIQFVVDSKVDSETTSPSDFAAMIDGLPTTATDELAITKFFEQNAVRGKQTEIVKVVIGWDAAEFRGKMKELRELRSELKLLESDDPTAGEKKQRIAQINAELVSSAPDKASRLKSSGTVVVVFRYQSDLQACLERWKSFWGRWLNCDADDSCCLPRGNGIWKGPPLPRFPLGERANVYRLYVRRAANPGDIHWEELGKPRREKIKLFMKTNAAMAGLVFVSFWCTWSLNKLQAEIKEEQQEKKGELSYGYQALSWVPAIGVSVVNAVLMVAARIFGMKEFHETWTDQEFSQAVKMAVSLLINTGGVLLFSNLQPKEWYEQGGLIDDAFWVLLIDAIAPPLFFYFDLKYRMMGYKRMKLTSKKMDSWNAIITASPPAPAAQRLEVLAEAQGFKRYFEPSEMNNARRYANAINTFICTLFYAPVSPFVALIGVGGLCLQYCIDKYLLLRWFKRPPRPTNARLAQLSLRFIKFLAPLGLTLSFFFFLSPSWKDKGQVFRPFLFSLIVSAIMILVPTVILRSLLCLPCCLRRSTTEVRDIGDYYNAQYLWPKEMKYHKDHFLYKRLPENINPEMLSPGASAAVKLDDIKASYGAATSQVAAGATDPTASWAPVTSLKGHGRHVSDQVVKVKPKPYDDPQTALVVGSLAPTDVSTVVPGIVAPVADIGVAAYTADDGGRKGGGKGGGKDGGKGKGKGKGGGSGIVWEFETDSGFRPFKDDCQEFLERKYQAWENGAKPLINVNTDGKTVSVDYSRMTQKLGPKIRKIRRNDRS